MLGIRFPKLQSFIKNKWDSKQLCRQLLMIWLKGKFCSKQHKTTGMCFVKVTIHWIKITQSLLLSPSLRAQTQNIFFHFQALWVWSWQSHQRERSLIKLGNIKVLLKIHVNLHCEKWNVRLDRIENQPDHRNYKWLLSSYLQGGINRSFYSHQTAVFIL